MSYKDLPGYGDEETWGVYKYAVGSPYYDDSEEEQQLAERLSELEDIILDVQNAYSALKFNCSDNYKNNLLSAQKQINLLCA